MATASITIELDVPDGVEIREYQRHGDGHAFHVAWPLPDREDSAGGREPDEPVRSLASTRLSISAPIRSTKLSATALS